MNDELRRIAVHAARNIGPFTPPTDTVNTIDHALKEAIGLYRTRYVHNMPAVVTHNQDAPTWWDFIKGFWFGFACSVVAAVTGMFFAIVVMSR